MSALSVCRHALVDWDLRSGLYANHFNQENDIQVPRYIFAVVLRGTGVHRDETGREFPFQPGDCFQRFPNAIHDTIFAEPENGVYWFVGLPPSCLEALRLCAYAKESQPVVHLGKDLGLVTCAAFS